MTETRGLSLEIQVSFVAKCPSVAAIQSLASEKSAFLPYRQGHIMIDREYSNWLRDVDFPLQQQ